MADINTTVDLSSHLYVEKLEFTRWAVFALYLVIFVIGVPGNLMIVAVYWASGIKTSTHVLIGSLAVADLLMCLLKFADAIAIASVPHYLAYDRESTVYFLSVGLLFSSALLTTAIAFDRFDAVCHSLRRKMTLQRAKLASSLCFVVGFIGLIPELVLKMQADNYDNYDTFKKSIVKAIPLSIYALSLLIVSVLYSCIFVFLRKRGKVESRDVPTIHSGVSLSLAGASFEGGSTVEIGGSDPHHRGRLSIAPRLPDVAGASLTSTKSSLHSRQADRTSSGRTLGTDRPRIRRPRGCSTIQSRITKMLFITTFMFFILWFPIVYLKVYALGTLFTDYQKSHHHANLVSALLVLRDAAFFNSVINVFIYGVANKRFLLESKRVIKNIRARFG